MRPFPTGPVFPDSPIRPETGIVVALWNSDATYQFEIQRAPDNGSGAPDTGSATSIADAVDGGEEWYIDELPLDGQTYWYRIRHVGNGDTPSSWTGWVSGVPTKIPFNIRRPAPVPPVVKETEALDSPSAGQATLTLTITDQQSRVSAVEFNTKAGSAAESGWTTDSTVPYAATVSVTAPGSRISYRVTGYDSFSVLRTLAENSKTYGTGPNALLVTAQITVTGETQCTVQVTVVDQTGGASVTLAHTDVAAAAVLASGSTTFTGSTSGTTTTWTVGRPSNRVGPGSITFTATASGRTTGQTTIVIPEQGIDVTSVGSLTVKENGDVVLSLSGSSTCQSHRYAWSTSVMPSDLSATGGTIVNGRTATITLGTLSNLGGRVYAKWVPYTSTGAGGNQGQIGQAEVDRQNKSTAKTIRLSHALLAPRDETTDVSYGVGGVSPGAKTSILLYGTLIAPRSAVLTAWRARMLRLNGTGSVTVDFYKMDDSEVATSIASLSHSGTGYNTASGSLSETVDGSIYTVLVTIDTTAATLANDNHFLYVEFDYTAGALDTTI